MQTGVNVLYENRVGGQTNYNPDRSVFLQNAYGVELNTMRIDGFNKLGLILNREKNQSVGFIVNGIHHQQKGFYGKRHYSGKQNTFYGNIIPQTQIGSDMHKLKTGLSFLYDDFDETFDTTTLSRTEIVPGAFAEYHFNYQDKLSILAGFRTDYHNLFSWQHTPRLHFKYNFTEKTVFRISGGRGFRVPNVFAENTNVLVSSRAIFITEKIQPEVSWNVGGGLLHTFDIKEKELLLSVEFYRTQFINQLIVDLDHHTSHAFFYNLNGKSYSNSFQVDASSEIIEGLTVKASYKFSDVKTTYNGVLLNRLMVARHNGLFNVAYTVPSEKWLFDFTLHFNGKARLAHNAYTETENKLSRFSPTYVTLNAQITKKWKLIEWYLGGENLTNFRQKDPIIDARNPFSPTFDASMVWGPIVGVVVYSGIRLTIK
jgi:outer membrane receptor for ferrienterochelin and colicins